MRNPQYWRTDEWKQRLPYLDRITFVPEEDGPTRLHRLEVNDYTIIQTSNARDIAQIRDDARAGKLGELESNKFAEVSYTMLNATTPPFNHLSARRGLRLRDRPQRVEQHA